MNAVVQQQATNQFLLPPGRIVQGDLYDPQTEDMQGNPLVVNQGPNKGEKRVNYFFAVAIRKNPGEQHWAQTPWGAKIYQFAMAAWPTWFDPANGACKHPKFAWKVSDGDDATPNPDAQMRRNCDREGFPGHWIVRCGSGFATKIFDDKGNALTQPGLVKRGWWVEVLISLQSNNNAQKPGIYVNHQMVAYRAPDKEIVSGPDPRSVGFGQSALPAGVTAQPLGNIANVAAAGVPGAAPGVPGMPGFTPPVPGAAAPGFTPGAAPGFTPPVPGAAAPGAVPGFTPPQQTAVQPHAGFMAPPGAGVGMPPVPGAPGVPGVPTAPPASVVCPLGAPMGYKMVNLNGPRYDAFRAQGWQDAQLLAGNHMVKL